MVAIGAIRVVRLELRECGMARYSGLLDCWTAQLLDWYALAQQTGWFHRLS